MIKTLYYLDKTAIKKFSELHSICFRNGPMFKLLFSGNQKSVRWVAEKRYKLMRNNYLSLVDEDYQGFSCWIVPEYSKKDTSVWKQLLAGYWKSPFKFGIKTFQKMMYFGKHEDQTKKDFLKEEAYILDIIAVHPSQQGKGLGGKLMQPVLDKAKQEKKNVFVFTQNPDNIPFYQKYGFKMIDSHVVRDPVKAYVFKIENN